MASPDVAIAAQVNGASTTVPLSRSGSPMSHTSVTKRKRDDSDGSSAEASPQTDNTRQDVKPIDAVNGTTQKIVDQKALIHDYFDVLRKYDSDAAVLNQPLQVEDETDAEPEAKRRKSESETTSTRLSIKDKVLKDDYATLEDILADITHATKARIAEIKSSSAELYGPDKAMDLVAKVVQLKDKAHDLYRRELAYPCTEQLQSSGFEANNVPWRISSGRLSLMTYATINNGKKPLLTSLQNPTRGTEIGGRSSEVVLEASLPPGITVAHAVGEKVLPEKPCRSRTLGELFPSPRNLPPLQPPKPNKGTTKGNVLTFYHPVLTDQSSYRTGTYFSQTLSTGQWLDYSNATPAAHKKTKQRERAQSLAGVKPSSTELNMSEMEALFRGAFSSFAPCKDDTAAIVSSGLMSRMYWQRYGRRNLQRIMNSDVQVDDVEPLETAGTDMPPKNNLPDVDPQLIKEVIDTWDDSAIDPSLNQIMGQKSDEEKEAEDLLQQVSDMIETLASYQRNRNLTLPTSQDRFSADPPNGDMLRNGALSHQPSEEEMLTYQALKAQLSLIISTLPPFAVARINSDKLEELSVSTKIEIRTNDFKGIMEEDERALRARQAATQASAAAPRATPQRTPSMSGATAYSGHHQFGGQYPANSRSSMPAAQHYQTTTRAQPSNPYQRPASAVQLPQPHPAQVRPSGPTQQQPYRAPNGYGGLAPQVAKPQASYGHSNMAPYGNNGVAGQARMQAHQSYSNIQQSASPSHRYQQPYQGGYPQQQHPQHQAQQPMHPPPHPGLAQQHAQQRPYQPYVNGAGHVPQRTMSPHSYSQSPTPPQPNQQMNRAPYGTPGQVMSPNGRNYNVGTPGVPAQAQNRTGNLGVTGYATVMGDAQQKQVMEQARQQVHAQQQVQVQQQTQAQARLDAQSRASSFGHETSHGNKVAGLAGIGLSGNMDIQRMAAMRAASASLGQSSSMSQSPKGSSPQPVRNMAPGGHGVNGGAVASNASVQAGNASPSVGSSSPAA